MDVISLINMVPDEYKPWASLALSLLATFGTSAVVAAWVPKSSTGILGLVRKIIDYLGQNYGNASNAK